MTFCPVYSRNTLQPTFLFSRPIKFLAFPEYFLHTFCFYVYHTSHIYFVSVKAFLVFLVNCEHSDSKTKNLEPSISCRNSVQEQSPVRMLVRNQDKSIVTSVSSKHKNVLGMCFCAPPGIADRSEFRSAVVMFVPSVACPCDGTLSSGDSLILRV